MQTVLDTNKLKVCFERQKRKKKKKERNKALSSLDSVQEMDGYNDLAKK